MKMRYVGAAMISAVVVIGADSIAVAAAQAPALTAQQYFEAGQYDEALKAIEDMRAQGTGGLPDAFLAAQIALKLTQNERANAEFARLTASDDPVWKLVGDSGAAAILNDRDRSAELGVQAVGASATGDPEDPAIKLRNFHAFYQLGLARTRKEDWAGAAESFTHAAALNPGFAYAHYYAGLSYSRIKRPDQVVKYFDTFLKLAPKAPERSAVQSLLRAIKGD